MTERSSTPSTTNTRWAHALGSRFVKSTPLHRCPEPHAFHRGKAYALPQATRHPDHGGNSVMQTDCTEVSAETQTGSPTSATVSARGPLAIAGCRSGSYLSRSVANILGVRATSEGIHAGICSLGELDYRFANTETCVRVERHVGGHDVFLFQSLCDPASSSGIDQNYMAFLMAARTFREHGAAHVTAVLPYLAYGRQDKPTEFRREPTTARLMADLSLAAGIDRLVAWHPHCGQLRGFYGSIPVNFVDPLTLFIDAFREYKGRRDVIAVAPDAGASKLAMYFSQALNVECAIGAKFRPRADESVIAQIVGDFTGKRVAIILDDELSTGGTLQGLVSKLAEEHGIREVHLAVSHSRCVPEARDRLCMLSSRYGLREVITTNSIPQTEQFLSLPFFSVRCLSHTLAEIVWRIHRNTSVSEAFYRPIPD